MDEARTGLLGSLLSGLSGKAMDARAFMLRPPPEQETPPRADGLAKRLMDAFRGRGMRRA